MKNLIEILPNIYGVKIKTDDFYVGVFYISDNETVLFCSNNAVNDDPITALIGERQILGTITKDEISFDASEFVEKDSYGYYKNYRTNNFPFSTYEQSFRSVLPEEIKENEKYLILIKL